jgi:hypothetical protein
MKRIWKTEVREINKRHENMIREWLGSGVKGNELYNKKEELEKAIEGVQWIGNRDPVYTNSAYIYFNEWKKGEGEDIHTIYPI